MSLNYQMIMVMVIAASCEISEAAISGDAVIRCLEHVGDQEAVCTFPPSTENNGRKSRSLPGAPSGLCERKKEDILTSLNEYQNQGRLHLTTCIRNHKNDIPEKVVQHRIRHSICDTELSLPSVITPNYMAGTTEHARARNLEMHTQCENQAEALRSMCKTFIGCNNAARA